MACTVLYLHNPTPQVLIEDQFIQSIGGEPEIGADDQVLTLRNLDDDITVLSGDLPELLSQIITVSAAAGIVPAAHTAVPTKHLQALLQAAEDHAETLAQLVLKTEADEPEANTSYRDQQQALEAALDHLKSRTGR